MTLAKWLRFFKPFFYQLYSLPDTLPVNAQERQKLLHDFLSLCALSKLTGEALESLNVLITVDEVEEVLKTLPTVKSPGPDGLYYQTFHEQLIPHITHLYNTFLEEQPIPSTMLHSYISLFAKPNKDPLVCSNYRLTALLN